MKPRISLFAEYEREDRRGRIGDPLVGLTKHVDFEALAASIDSAAPRPYNLADDALEYQLLDRRSFLQFLDLTESSSIPDAKTSTPRWCKRRFNATSARKPTLSKMARCR